MTRSHITIETSTGKRTVDAHLIGEILAVHATVGASIAPPFTLTHVPSGHAIARTERERDAVKIAEHLAAQNLNGTWSSSDPLQVGAAIPADVVTWLMDCREARAYVSPGSTAAQPQEKKMPRLTKEQQDEQQRAREKQAKQIANKVVEKARRAIKPPAKDEIAQGWWQSLKQDVAAAILAG